MTVYCSIKLTVKLDQNKILLYNINLHVSVTNLFCCLVVYGSGMTWWRRISTRSRKYTLNLMKMERYQSAIYFLFADKKKMHRLLFKSFLCVLRRWSPVVKFGDCRFLRTMLGMSTSVFLREDLVITLFGRTHKSCLHCPSSK